MNPELQIVRAPAPERPIAPWRLQDWWDRVAGLGCLITGHPEPTLHHIHGGSVAQAGYHSGMALRGISHWLVIPLHWRLHTGPQGIDGSMGIPEWELRYGDQVELMDDVCRRTGFNAWRQAGIAREPY